MREQNSVDTESAPATGGRRRGCRGCLVKLFLILLVGSMGAMLAAYLWRSNTEEHLSKQIQSLRDMGVPTDPRDIADQYVVAGGQLDTTKEWLESLATLGSATYQAEAAEHPLVGDMPPPPFPPTVWRNSAATIAFTQSLRDPIINLQLAASGHALMPMDFENEPRLPEETMEKMRRGFRLLQLNCYVQAHEQNLQGLAVSLAALLNYSNCLDRHPGHVDQRLQFEIEAFQQVADFIQRVEFTDASLKQFQTIAEDRDYWSAIQFAWNQQRANRLLLYTDLQRFKKTGLSEEFRTEPRWSTFWNKIDVNLRYSPFAAQDAEQFLAYMYQIESEFSGNYRASAEKVASLESEILNSEPGRLERIRYPTARFMVPPVAPLIEKAGQAESLRQVLLAALASDRYRIANGEFPQALDRLSPDYLPTPAVDLFTDEPLKYSRNADSMIVYNCGPNLRDDRGGKDDQAIRVFLQKWDPSGDGSLKVD